MRFFIICLITISNLYSQPGSVYFHRMEEPREKALSFLVPKGWIIEGGAIRLLDPGIAGASNMVDCKFDMAVKKDASGTVMIRWLPEMLCIDQSMAFGNPEGAIFNNSLVRRKRDPQHFIFEIAIPYAHPAATNVTLISGKALPGLASKYQSGTDPSAALVTNMSYQAYLAEFSYTENGIKFRERMTVVIEDYGRNGGGLWKNRETMLIRAPEGHLSEWEAVLNVIQNSGKWNLKWVTDEVNNQRRRAGQIIATQQEIEAIEKAINDNRQDTNTEINKDMYLTLTGQDEFTNPFNGKPEIDTNAWDRRWLDEIGNVIYTNDSDYNPNTDPNLNVSGFKLSAKKQ